jgi:hypothetical protein
MFWMLMLFSVLDVHSYTCVDEVHGYDWLVFEATSFATTVWVCVCVCVWMSVCAWV